MKIGNIMENQKTTFCTMSEEPLVKVKKGPLKLVVAAVVALVIVGAIALSAAFIGGKIANDTIKETSYVFHTNAGQLIDETISITDQEEEIGLQDGTRVVYDFSKGIMVMKITDDGEDVCYVTTFERNKMHLPSEGELFSMNQENVNMSMEVDYYVDKSIVVNPAMLSQMSRDICTGSTMYWMTSSLTGDKTGRHKRGCRRVCSAYCSCCPRDCGVRCNIECSW